MRRVSILVMLGISSLLAGAGSRTSAQGTVPAKGNAILSLPSGMDPTRLFTTTTASLLIKAAKDAKNRYLFSWQAGQAPALITVGRDLEVTRLGDNTFAAWYFDGGQEKLVTLDGQKLLSKPLLLPNGGPTGWQSCRGNVVRVVCIGNLPTTRDDDSDEMGFTAVLVVNLETRKMNWFPVDYQTYFRFDLARKMIYVTDDHRIRVRQFDLAGDDKGSAHVSNVMMPSPSGQFLETLQEDGSEFWAVDEASTMKPLLSFNCDRPGCKEGDRDEDNQHWNPKFSHQLVVIRDGGAYGIGGACDVYQLLDRPNLLKTVPCEGLPVYDWSRDGKAIVTIETERGRFSRQPIN